MLNKSNRIMKKIILFFAAVAMAAGVASAQDINSVTEIYNNGAMELNMGNKDAALAQFQTALSEAEALGDEGLEIAENCKVNIVAILSATAKELLKAEQYDAAMEQLNKTIETANHYGNTSAADEAKTLISQALLAKANNALQNKDFATAVEAYQVVLAENPANGLAHLYLGRAYTGLGKVAEAEAAFLLAAENGKEKDAYKQLSTIYVKLAQAANKAKNFQDAYDKAMKSNGYLENANAYRIAAGAAQQLGKTEECIGLFEKYLELKPNAKDASGVKYTIAVLFQQAGNKEKAKEYYQMVVADPQYGAGAVEQLKNL